jgi:hypothetical protein
MMTMLQGPVGTAARGGRVNPWFAIGVGTLLLAYAWIRHLAIRKETNPPIGRLLGFSAICLIIIAVGVWELVH